MWLNPLLFYPTTLDQSSLRLKSTVAHLFLALCSLTLSKWHRFPWDSSSRHCTHAPSQLILVSFILAPARSLVQSSRSLPASQWNVFFNTGMLLPPSLASHPPSQHTQKTWLPDYDIASNMSAIIMCLLCLGTLCTFSKVTFLFLPVFLFR